jgi:hypothetical protein
MSTFRNRPPIDTSVSSPLCTPHRMIKKVPPLAVNNSSQVSSRPRRAAAIKADERIQQICADNVNENSQQISSNLLSSRSESIDVLIDQIDSLHIERKLKFDDDDENDNNNNNNINSRPSTTEKSNEQLVQQCQQLHDRLAYAPNAKLLRYLSEYIILLSGDQDPWLIAALVVEMQAIGFRYNALCIYQRKKRLITNVSIRISSSLILSCFFSCCLFFSRHQTDRTSTPLLTGSHVSQEHLSDYIDALHFRPLTISYLKETLINEHLPSRQVCLCLHSFTLIDNQILAIQLRGQYYAPVIRRVYFPRLLVKKFHFLIESNTHTLHGITDHKRYWAIRRYFEQLFERLLDDLNHVYLASPMRWWWLPETSIFDGKKAMIDDLLVPLTSSKHHRLVFVR